MPTRRHSMRLPDYNYADTGAYFITICTHNKKSNLGLIENGRMLINDLGGTIQAVWDKLPKRFPDVQVDAFTIMPNHVHGIIIVGAQFIAPRFVTSNDDSLIHPMESAIENVIEQVTNHEGVMNHAPTLGEIVRTFKAVSTRLIRENYDMQLSWQRNYYEHVIRNDESLNRIREYIFNNPWRWDLDRENPLATGKDDFDLWLATFKRRPEKNKRAQ